MSEAFIYNIGRIVTGSFDAPIAEGDAIVVRGGRIAALGRAQDVHPGKVTRPIDANGTTVIPGLIDSHFHPVFGDYTPRQKAVDFIESCVHGGVTRFVSAGEVHLPGRPVGALAAKALAIVGAQTWAGYRPAGAKVHGGALLLQEGLIESDFEELAAAGVTHLGEVGLGGYHDWERVAEMVTWARRHGLKAMMHVGGASIPGSDAIRASHVLQVRPDVASHLNGGPTAPSLADVDRLIRESDVALEIVQCGNVAVIPQIIGLARDNKALWRVIIGTDMPSGTGVVPLGMLRTVGWVSALGSVAPELAIAMATGNTARIYGLPAGIISPGTEADLVFLDAPVGSVAADAMEALSLSDTPGVAGVMIDGTLVVAQSRNTPPARRQLVLDKPNDRV